MAYDVKITEWRGQDVMDDSAERVGKLEDIYYDTDTDEPVFGSLKTGMLGRNLVFVPLDGATVGRSYVQVPLAKKMIDDGPSIGADSELPRRTSSGSTATTGWTTPLPPRRAGVGSRGASRREDAFPGPAQAVPAPGGGRFLH